MPGLSPEEIAKLAPDAIALADDIRYAFTKGSDGGKKLTARELRKLAGRLIGLAGKFIVQALD